MGKDEGVLFTFQRYNSSLNNHDMYQVQPPNTRILSGARWSLSIIQRWTIWWLTGWLMMCAGHNPNHTWSRSRGEGNAEEHSSIKNIWHDFSIDLDVHRSDFGNYRVEGAPLLMVKHMYIERDRSARCLLLRLQINVVLIVVVGWEYMGRSHISYIRRLRCFCVC